MYKMQIKLRLQWCVFFLSLSFFFFFLEKDIWFFPPFPFGVFSWNVKVQLSSTVWKAPFPNDFSPHQKQVWLQGLSWFGHVFSSTVFPGQSDWYWLCNQRKSNSPGFKVKTLQKFLWCSQCSLTAIGAMDWGTGDNTNLSINLQIYSPHTFYSETAMLKKSETLHGHLMVTPGLFWILLFWSHPLEQPQCYQQTGP